MLPILFVLTLIQSSLTAGPAIIQLTEPVDHGEGPVWDDRTGILYFVDMFNGKLNAYDTVNDELSSVTLNGDLTLAVPCESSEECFIVGLNKTVVKIEWDGKSDSLDSFEILTVVDTDKSRNRLNDGKADKVGRLWFGTMGYEYSGELVDINSGSLYLITNENLENPEIVVSSVNISNGMAWNQANDKFYFTDTTANQITEYDYDNISGNISNPRIVFNANNFSDTITGYADGLTIDTDDKLWIALYGGGAVIQFDPQRGEILQSIALPAEYTTSVCWGGEDYDVLFVTTSRFLLSEDEREEQPTAGSLFAVTNLESYGIPSYKSKIATS